MSDVFFRGHQIGAPAARVGAPTPVTREVGLDGTLRLEYVLLNSAPFAADLLLQVLEHNDRLGARLPLVARRRLGLSERPIYLHGPLRPMLMGSAFDLKVWAEGVGSALHCGWRVTHHGGWGITHWQRPALDTRGSIQSGDVPLRLRVDRSPEGVHALAQLTNIFDEAVFTPALQFIVDAVGDGSMGVSAGFLGLT